MDCGEEVYGQAVVSNGDTTEIIQAANKRSMALRPRWRTHEKHGFQRRLIIYFQPGPRRFPMKFSYPVCPPARQENRRRALNDTHVTR